jgi:hypothetical protein
MRFVVALAAIALVCATGASGSTQHLSAPARLHAFVLRADEPVKRDHTYAQMPAFAWTPVTGASRYELQLSTNASFGGGAVFVDRRDLKAPATSVDVQVPWMTGHPYAFWARVRAVGAGDVSRWSAPFGFNTEWQQLPRKLPAPAGLVRWTPVEGATAYDVWFENTPKGTVHVRSLTNVADTREYWPSGPSVVRWRVRAVRYVSDQSLPDEIHVESHGPYTETFETPRSSAAGIHAIADRDSTASHPAATALMPGFAWGTSNGLSRVYVYSDRRCVNVVTVGTIVAGPAWAPRASTSPADDPGAGVMADGVALTATSEEAFGAAADAASSPAKGTSSSGGTAAAAPSDGAEPDPGHIALPDNGWPSGRYWWTVVPVNDTLQDLELPQDACAAGHVWQFGLRSTPVLTSGQAPFASGLAGTRVVSSAAPRPAFDQLPVITWVPALGAQGYQIQLSRTRYPWVARRTIESLVPAATLPLTKKDLGTWYYRVRGLNGNLPGTATTLTWSKPVAIRIAGDRFVVHR